MAVRGVLFDVDDTLFDYSGAEEAGILAHLVAEGLLGAFACAERAVSLWREVMDVEYARFLRGELTFSQHQRERARRFLTAIGAVSADGLADAAAGTWFARYHSHYAAAWTAFPDAAPALAQLGPGLRLGVVSNSARAKQEQKLRAIGLLGHFSCVVCSEDVGAAKPDPRIFRAGCAALGLPPEDVVYVGDRVDVDAVGARDAGLYAVWLDRAGLGGAPEGVAVIDSLALLPDLVAEPATYAAAL